MSLYHENFVWWLDMPALKKLVMCYVAREARLSTAEANLTIREIAFRCGMSDSAVRSNLKELEEEGLLTRLPAAGKRLLYRITLEGAAHAGTS